MKLCFALLAFLVASGSARRNDREEAEAKVQECLRENGVSMEEYEKTQFDQHPSHNIKCVHLCTAIRLGTNDENGNVKIEQTLALFVKDDTKYAAIKKCYDETKGISDKCDRNYAFFYCFSKIGFD